ncbi:hypothetical protein C1646_773048 [Rhizophagus diaphanus]|nr:hypothetical protein C1646_773048 [Rhizophagus diaphanus] [Rhizophagus sp. MUCL 43196]
MLPPCSQHKVVRGFSKEECGKRYPNANKWCNPYQLNYLIKNFTNWNSGDENAFLNKVKVHLKLYQLLQPKSISDIRLLKIYGISQDPNTKDYIIILKYINDGIHRDFHTGNILIEFNYNYYDANQKLIISDMGLCGEVAANIYSFGMIMYFVTTAKQPFASCDYDQNLILDICEGIRFKINELKAS